LPLYFRKSLSEKIEQLIEQINLGKPIQYICGFAFFYDLILKVNQNVLIPRSETEELAEWIVEFCKEKNLTEPSILDIGTGSGCIALALKSKLKNAEITAVEIDEKALEVAKQNANENNLEVHFECFDVLNYLPNKQTQLYDIIISNPPYINENEIATMQQSVLDFEPAISLFVTNGDDLQFYKSINAFARQYLKSGGTLFYEINENNGERMENLMKHYQFKNIVIKKDMQNKDRMLRADWNV